MEYNPFLPDVRENPYPYYAYLREHAPVYQVPGAGFWALSRYDDVYSALRNPQVFSATILITALIGEFTPFAPEAPSMVGQDPPDHTRLRKLANRAFTPRRIASLEAHLREVVNKLLDPIAEKGTCDLVKDLAAPLPTIAVAELLGVPPERRDDFRRWSDDVVHSMNVGDITEEDKVQIRRSIADFRAYFKEAIESCRRRPGDNLLSDLVRAEEEQQRLTSEEILSLAILIIAAGNETTTNLISNTVTALFRHPDILATVRANPALVSGLLDEMLRYDSPVQVWFRLTMQEVEVAGTTLPPGSVVTLLLGSANHDERKFADPERLDIRRNPEHVAFGYGTHYCLGAPLARLEAKLALEGLLSRFPKWERQDEPPTRMFNPFLRGFKSLPLVMG